MLLSAQYLQNKASVPLSTLSKRQLQSRRVWAYQKTQKTKTGPDSVPLVQDNQEEEEEEVKEVSEQLKELVQQAKDQWNSIENKGPIAVYLVLGVTAVWLSTAIVTTIHSVPLLPQIMEFVGLTYTAWFAYRYLLFKDGRDELLGDVETLKKKMGGE